MRLSRVIVAALGAVLAASFPITAKDTHNWITGTVVDISATQRPNGRPVYVYTINTGNREFVIRLESPQSANGVDGEQASAGLPANVGELITFAPQGMRAWVRAEGKEYQCSVLRQRLLSLPASAQPPDLKPADKAKEQASTVEFSPPPVIPTPNPPPSVSLRGLQPASTTTTTATADASAGASQSVNRVGGGVTAPALLYKVPPEYSEEARRAKLEGTVILYVEVSPDGHAVNPRVVRSLGLGLDEKAIEAVRKWQFRPGYKDGKAVTVAATIEVNFVLLRNSPKAPAPSHPPAMLEDSASYLQRRLGLWEPKDAKEELGRVVGRSKNAESEIFTFADPTKRYRAFDLMFDVPTKKLVAARIYPWEGLSREAFKPLCGGGYSETLTSDPKVVLYSCLGKPITALVRTSGEIVSFEFRASTYAAVKR